MEMKSGIVAILAVCVGACTQQPTPTGEDFRDVPASLVMIGMRSFVTNNGIRTAQLVGDTGFVYEDSSKIHVKKVNLKFFNEQGVESGSLTSRTGDFNTNTQAMIARGTVVLVTTTGNRRIETEELHYDPQSHRLWSEKPTVLIEPGSRVTGTGFTADDKFQNVRITNPRGRVGGSGFKF
jgi:LPS export ABC transporter protein LptC